MAICTRCRGYRGHPPTAHPSCGVTPPLHTRTWACAHVAGCPGARAQHEDLRQSAPICGFYIATLSNTTYREMQLEDKHAIAKLARRHPHTPTRNAQHWWALRLRSLTRAARSLARSLVPPIGHARTKYGMRALQLCGPPARRGLSQVFKECAGRQR